MKTSNLIINLCILLIAFSLARTNATTRTATAEDFIRMRCNTDKAQDTILSWSGMSYSLEPQKQQQPLFGLFGINLARCWKDNSGSWQFTSRELQYYLDPETSKPLYKWNNPWTGETQNVVHVANDPVQFEYGTASAPYELQGGDYATFVNTVNLFYPNPLYKNATLRPYANYAEYEGSELFKFFTPENEVLNASATFAPSMHFSWTRISQWLPFMNMNGRPGSMMFTASGSRTTFEELPQWLQDDINNRIPLYRHAPRCMLDLPDSTSWTYFQEHFESYLNGDQFPIPVSAKPPCQH